MAKGKYARKRRPSRTPLLALLTVAAVAVTLYCALDLIRDPAGKPALTRQTQPPTESQEPIQPPPPTEAPTEPPKYINRYDQLSFGYDEDGYMTLLREESILGVDVSKYQGDIDWKKVKQSGVEFAMIRLGNRGYGNGNIVEDPYFKANMEGAKAAGIKVGVYFFSQAISVAEAVEEAQFVLDTLAGAELDMPVVYDWEYISEEARTAHVDRRTLTDCSLAFLQHIETAGYKPMLYINTSQVRNLLHLSELEHYDCWLALYSDTMSYPYRIKMWQYTCTGSVPGIKGPCDVNLYFPEVS